MTIALKRSAPITHVFADDGSIPNVPRPATDPVFGADGPLWRA